MKLSNLITVISLATAGLTALTAHADSTIHNHKIFSQDAVPPLSELKIKEGDNWVTRKVAQDYLVSKS